MFKKPKTGEQINQHEEPKPAEKTQITMRKLQAIKNELSQLKHQYEELRLFLEDKYEVLPYNRHGFADLNTILDRKLEVKDPFKTENGEYHKESFETSLHPETPNAKQHEKPISHPIEHMHLSIDRSSLATLSLIASGLTILAWVGWLTWYDMTTWSKDVILIFFGSRTGEAVSLGIGMIVIYYFVAGIALLLSGLINLLRKRRHQTTPRQEHPRLGFDVLRFQ